MPLITDWLLVIITAIYAITTICILLANKASAKATKMQAEEMKRQFEQENRPYITTELIYEKRTFWGLRFSNHGRKIAEHVLIDYDASFIESLSEPFKQIITSQRGKECIIGVGQHYDLFFGKNDIRGKKDLEPVKGEITYTNNGIKYTGSFNIDLKNYMTFYSIFSEEEDMIKALREQNRELKEINACLQKMVEQRITSENSMANEKARI